MPQLPARIGSNPARPILIVPTVPIVPTLPNVLNVQSRAEVARRAPLCAAFR
ncbi:hypothetical protein [Chitinasiproducens palmae]|uniref:Uncharacterized protein n=1 Tax=Chitinasiproducens palmae TaxID=1770053 RepID=A0A1H2PU83_9BURK|nr:hypothetical protein [Chitinasiproducens palmae]SDV50733.1 hypothetical protein SAMN05216551_11354 [Chitinasiproducens palmae]